MCPASYQADQASLPDIMDRVSIGSLKGNDSLVNARN